MSAMIFILLAVLPIILILYFQKHKTKPLSKYPPGPKGLPFIGNLHQFDGEFPHKSLYKLSRKYGPIVSMKLGFRQILVINSSEVINEIMKFHDIVFSNRPSLVIQQKLSYNGLDVAFASYNESWKELRKIFHVNLFSAKQVKNFIPKCKDEVSILLKNIAEDASKSRMSNLSEKMTAFCINTNCRIALGKSYDDKNAKNPFIEVLRDTQGVLGGFVVEDYLPSLKWIDKISGMSGRLEKNFKDLDSLYDQIIEEHLDSNRSGGMEGDIIDLLLALKRDGSSMVEITRDNIKALLMNIITGAIDLSSSIQWTLTILMRYPVIMKRVLEEIRRVGENKDMIDVDEIAEMPYFRAVIKETFRLYPPAPLLVPRETTEKCTLKGYEIPAGTMVYFNAWAIARDPECWKNPNEFMPERFLDRDLDVRGRDPEVIPFGIGRRGCPGIAMGMAEVELALANILFKFDWELPHGMKPEDVDFDELPGMTMHKKNPLCLAAKFVHV